MYQCYHLVGKLCGTALLRWWRRWRRRWRRWRWGVYTLLLLTTISTTAADALRHGLLPCARRWRCALKTENISLTKKYRACLQSGCHIYFLCVIRLCKLLKHIGNQHYCVQIFCNISSMKARIKWHDWCVITQCYWCLRPAEILPIFNVIFAQNNFTYFISYKYN